MSDDTFEAAQRAVEQAQEEAGGSVPGRESILVELRDAKAALKRAQEAYRRDPNPVTAAALDKANDCYEVWLEQARALENEADAVQSDLEGEDRDAADS